MKMKHNNKGFSLVELIVVIAIMAILGGVGTAGYSKYIENTNKKADMALVGNIMRAIETGTNSTMFVNDDSFKMGNLSYPIGFITLSTDGSSVVTSSTEMKEVDTRSCVYETIPNIVVRTPQTYSSGCTKDTTDTYYTISNGSIKYCKTHSPNPVIENVQGQNYVSNFTHKKGNSITGCLFSCGGLTPTYSQYPSGSITVSNQEELYEEKSSGLCEYAYANQNATYSTDTKINGLKDSNGIAQMDTSHELYKAIEAAFDNPSTLKLRYDGWTKEEGIDYATFYESAPSLMSDVKTLGGLLIVGEKLASLANKSLGLSGSYEDTNDVVIGVSNNIATSHPTEISWLAVWENDAEMTWDSYGFNLEGRENYSAARVGYNNAFASYLDAIHPDGVSPYSDIIRDFNSQELFGVGLPGLVCTDAFTDADSPLKNKFNATALAEVQAAYEDYINSPVCKENGIVLYNALVTFSQTSDVAKAYTDMYGGSIFDYYNSYVDEMAALYEAASDSANGGIVIIVSVENGTLSFNVSPSAANPRKIN